MLRRAATSRARVDGHTHRFYKYPARFSPTFAREAITQFSRLGDVVLDPYMGGGTSVVEALALGRHAIGCDLNSLAVFVARVKTEELSSREASALGHWATSVVPRLSFHETPPDLITIICERRTQNLNLPRARGIKKCAALALLSLDCLPTDKARRFARCALLNVCQKALNGRKRPMTLSEFREQLAAVSLEMIQASGEFSTTRRELETRSQRKLIHASSEHLASYEPFKSGKKVDLVVTSPPYPGVHVLYHRWQVDGRKETAAPYWIANCLDGHGAAYYNFGGRSQLQHDDYFDQSLRTLRAVRSVMRRGAIMVQMVAFSRPEEHLPRYTKNMLDAGFEALPSQRGHAFIERKVPGRTWHASMKGDTPSAREMVLLHVAV